MKNEVKSLLNNTGIIKYIKGSYLYKKYKIRKIYREKAKCSWIHVISKIKIYHRNYKKIFRNVRIEDCGVGNFFYNLDDSVIVCTKNRIIDNIPVDYSYILNTTLENNKFNSIIKRYIDRINDSRINLNKPTNLQEALQMILFWNSLLWQTGHGLVGLGRLDKVLDKYELPQNGEKLIKDFLRTLHSKYTFKSSKLLGDTGQLIILGGLETNGTYFVNQYTYLFIKCLNELRLPDPKILLRCSKNMPMELLALATDCISSGIGSPLISNDDVIIPNLIDFRYEKKDAYNYGVSACWEPLSIGNSLEQNNIGNIEFGKCINQTILDSRFESCSKFSDVYEIYKEKLKLNIKKVLNRIDKIVWEEDPLLSLLMGLKKDISRGGAKYNNYGLMSVGMSSAVNSLLNIKHFVFDEKKYSLRNVKDVIINNYEKADKIWSENNFGFGTDEKETIELTNQLIRQVEDILEDYQNCFGGKIKFGLSSSSYIDRAKNVGATLDGRKAGEPFQTHISRDKGESITEILNFASKLHITGISCNANVVDVIIQPNLFWDNKKKIVQYIMSGIRAGVFQMQINVISYEQLLDAKTHPEKYPNLIVRVWGFSAYFKDLPEAYKNNLIKRAKEMESVT